MRKKRRKINKNHGKKTKETPLIPNRLVKKGGEGQNTTHLRKRKIRKEKFLCD